MENETQTTRKDTIKILMSMSAAEAREFAMTTLERFCVRGGYFSISPKEQEIYSVIREFLTKPELIKLEAGL